MDVYIENNRFGGGLLGSRERVASLVGDEIKIIVEADVAWLRRPDGSAVELVKDGNTYAVRFDKPGVYRAAAGNEIMIVVFPRTVVNDRRISWDADQHTAVPLHGRIAVLKRIAQGVMTDAYAAGLEKPNHPTNGLDAAIYGADPTKHGLDLRHFGVGRSAHSADFCFRNGAVNPPASNWYIELGAQ